MVDSKIEEEDDLSLNRVTSSLQAEVGTGWQMNCAPRNNGTDQKLTALS